MEERAARSSRLSGDLVRGQVPEGGRGGQSQQAAKTGLEELLAGLLRGGREAVVCCRPVWRGGGPPAPGAAPAGGVVIGHGLSFKVGVFRASPQPCLSADA